jgi:hypothetical protein
MLRATVSGQTIAGGWPPIGAAPRDGTPVILWLEEDEKPPVFPEPVGFWTVNPHAEVGYWRLFGISHASARTGIFADSDRVFVSETVAAKPQPPAHDFVLPRWLKGSHSGPLVELRVWSRTSYAPYPGLRVRRRIS